MPAAERVFSEAEYDRLRVDYQVHADGGRLAELAADMGRTKPFICRKARDLGLTDKARGRPYSAVWKHLSAVDLAPAWEAFKASPLGVAAYCEEQGFDDLGFSRAMQSAFADEWDFVIELKMSRNAAYRVGRAFEYRVRDDLRRRGYHAARSHLSKSPADLLAFRTGEMLMIQCRLTPVLGVECWNALFDLAVSVGAVPALAGSEGDGLVYWRITGPKTGCRQDRQPMDLLVLPEAR